VVWAAEKGGEVATKLKVGMMHCDRRLDDIRDYQGAPTLLLCSRAALVSVADHGFLGFPPARLVGPKGSGRHCIPPPTDVCLQRSVPLPVSLLPGSAFNADRLEDGCSGGWWKMLDVISLSPFLLQTN